MLQGGTVGELLSLNVPRTEAEIQQRLDEARSLERMADGELETGGRLADEATSRAKIMEEEMEVTKARRDAAKKAKDKAAAADLDASVKKQTIELKYLERLRETLRADLDRLGSSKASAEAAAKSLELELHVVRKQAVLGAQPTPESVNEYRTLLRQMLVAQRDAADRVREASDKRKRVAEQRLKQLDALAKLGTQ